MRPILCLEFVYVFSSLRYQAASAAMLVLMCRRAKQKAGAQRAQVACLRAHRSGKSQAWTSVLLAPVCSLTALYSLWLGEKGVKHKKTQNKRESKGRGGQRSWEWKRTIVSLWIRIRRYWRRCYKGWTTTGTALCLLRSGSTEGWPPSRCWSSWAWTTL